MNDLTTCQKCIEFHIVYFFILTIQTYLVHKNKSLTLLWCSLLFWFGHRNVWFYDQHALTSKNLGDNMKSLKLLSNVDLYGYRMTRWRTWSASTWWATGRVRISGSPVWNITRFSASTSRTLRQRKSSPWDPSSATGEWAAQTG